MCIVVRNHYRDKQPTKSCRSRRNGQVSSKQNQVKPIFVVVRRPHQLVQRPPPPKYTSALLLEIVSTTINVQSHVAVVETVKSIFVTAWFAIRHRPHQLVQRPLAPKIASALLLEIVTATSNVQTHVAVIVMVKSISVSYTHLTLPTILLV